MRKNKKSLSQKINEDEFKKSAEKATEDIKDKKEFEQQKKDNGSEPLLKKPMVTEEEAKRKKSHKTKLAVAAFVLLLGVGIMGNWYYENTDLASSVKPLITSTKTKNLGEAEFVGGTTTTKQAKKSESEYFSSARLEREKARDEALEKLQKVIDSTEESETAKQEASQQVSLISNYISIENKIETLVTAKGVSNCLAVVSNDGIRVDVIVDCEELTDSLILQIKEIAMQQLDCSFENVSIIQSN